MLNNDLVIALRHFSRNKGYTLVNVLGLAVGMACAILIFLYVGHELSYDRYHEQADRIYRVVFNDNAKTPRSVGPALQADFPEVQDLLRLHPTTGTWVMKYEDRIYYERAVYWAGSSLFDFFALPLVQGDPESALEAPYTVVISEDTARKYFGDKDPMGKTIVADNGFMLLTVTGILENMPANTHFQADFFISLASGYEEYGRWSRENWDSFFFYTYIMLEPGVSPAELAAKLPGFVDRHVGEQLQRRGGRYEFSLQPVTNIHLYSHLENEPGINTDISYVYILAAMGLFILVIVCINYVNLTTAQFVHRFREIGMRKVLGASRLHLVRQYLGESVLLAFAALLIALLAVWLVSPWFDALTGMPASAGFMGNAVWWVALPAAAVFIGLLSGGYPAIRLSAFGTVPGLKEGRSACLGRPGRPHETDRALSRKVLVVVQFAISIALIIGTGVLFSQISYIQNKHLGFDREQVIAIPSIAEVAYQYQPWKDELLRHSGVVDASQGVYLPGLEGNIGWVTSETAWRVDDPNQVKHDLQGIIVAAGYAETLGLELLAGRSFSGPLDSKAESDKILLNESALRVLGWDTPEEALGEQVQFGIGMTQTVIGVVRDFHLRSLHLPIEPLVILYGRGQLMVVRIQPGETTRTLDLIEQAWARYFPDFPFTFSFINEDIDRLYRAEERIGYVFAVFAVVGVLLACMGLFALVSYTVERRVREIGIRKALGASSRRMLVLLSAEFAALVLLANAIAWPAARLFMNRWLESFAYRIEMGWGIFFASGGIALLITMITIGYHVIRTALANPAEVLRGE
ncbi:MAG: FtsX-like permease family protein [Gemmatimonadetes bacterium]|nr:FtsX-like permease family protein [Gemmatimonadota bacterium]MYD26763.1 FtsX-like permease family protein [Gemmatimonadota bacterium]